ncbi:MAG: hypothetical protein WA231_17260, partial [Methylocella sp.]
FVEKVRLLSILSSHHRRIILPSSNQKESSFSPSRKPFFDSIDPKQKSDLRPLCARIGHFDLLRSTVPRTLNR